MTDETPTRGTPRDWEHGDAFAGFLRRHGDAYNPPPETPVEAIWKGVREGRERGRKVREGVREGRERGDESRRVIPIAPRRWLLPVLAVAAVLLVGIAIGRISMRQAAERQGPAGPTVATRAEPAPERPVEDATPPATRDDVPPAAPADLAVTTPRPAEDRSGTARPAGPGGPTSPERPIERPAPSDGPARPFDPARPGDPARPDRAGELYRLASVQMLAQAEALLVDYRSGRAAGREDGAEIGRWARDVLASTRLLLGTRATRDPAMRSLLEDLELVLAQIVHRTGADPIEGEMIDRSLEERDLIPRLRTAIPSGDAASL